MGTVGQAWRNGFVTEPNTFGSWRSGQESTPNTTSAYSHDAVQYPSLWTISSPSFAFAAGLSVMANGSS